MNWLMICVFLLIIKNINFSTSENIKKVLIGTKYYYFPRKYGIIYFWVMDIDLTFFPSTGLAYIYNLTIMPNQKIFKTNKN